MPTPARVIDFLSGREVPAGPEEIGATQPMAIYLIDKLGWNPKQVITRPQWRVPRSPSGSRGGGYPIDIAVFDSPEHANNPDHVCMLVECKAPSISEGVEQLKIYLSLQPAARVGVWFNGQSHRVVYKTSQGFVESEFAPIPRPGDPLAPAGRSVPLRFGDLLPPPNLGDVFSRLRDHIAGRDEHINRDEFILNDLANLLICKIADEQSSELSPKRTMAFQSAASDKLTADAIRQFFETVKTRLASVFADPDERLHLDDESIATVVRMLERYRLLGHDRHAVGKAFEVLRGRALKGEEGAYFTPPPVVDCIISVLDPDPETKLLDPACGTGGFLAAALDYVFARVDELDGVPPETRALKKRSWAGDDLYAIDKDAVSVRLCKAYLTLLGDGRAHAYRANSITQRDWSSRTDGLARDVRAGSFDLIVTNPPFGSNLKVGADVGEAEQLVTCKKWVMRDGRWEPGAEWCEQQLGIVFFERSLQLLKPGGRIGIVLPETFLFSPGFRWFVDWIVRSYTVTHCIDVPMVAFEEFCRAKTCILVVAKRAPAPGHRIVMSYPRTIGQDKRGNPLLSMDASGARTGSLDNEMADAVRNIVGARYDGTNRPPGVVPQAEGRFRFSVLQDELLRRPVLVPRYWWRADLLRALTAWSDAHDCDLVSLGALAEEGTLASFAGHGSPPGNARRTGRVPYVKVTDLKNWRIIENPTNFIHESEAARLRRSGPELAYGDLVSPARASANIGQFCMVLPWQTNIVLTKEVLILRVNPNDRQIDQFLLLAMLSLHVVLAQYETLALMQTNREHLGDRWREVLVPVPRTEAGRRAVSDPVRAYFDAMVAARTSYSTLLEVFDAHDFAVRP